MTRILIVENNVLLATTLVRFLRDRASLKVVAVAPSAELALAQLSEHSVDLVLVDIALSGMSGIDFIAVLHKQYPDLPCLVLSAHTEISYVRRALSAGARGYVVKGDPMALLTAIQEVVTGEEFLSEELRQKLYH
jgi:DNA-binding NarL/FixJ family response regulator